jgi:hypothetical protein
MTTSVEGNVLAISFSMMHLFDLHFSAPKLMDSHTK